MDYFRKLITSYENFRNSHKYLPTDSSPQKLEKTLFFNEHLVYKQQIINYNEINAISTKYSTKTINSIQTEIYITFRIYYNNFESSKNSYIDLSYNNEIFGWRKREITSIVINFLKDKTFTNRLNNYLIELRTQGYFNYLDGKIYNNGDIFSKDNFIANLYEENKNGNVWFGVSFSSPLGRNKLSDPYLLRIKNAKKDTNIFQKRDFDIDTQYNKDVFDALITQIIEKGFVMEK
ncbi:hypothetical protein [Flavobacterium sp.]|uniref:hypothetical protein n=1 Tax=Flavobacterium sp. TaxID=239 RepID=UPI00286B89AD|nr:hypothetical protein [Flavobacterium sp.]